MSNNSRRIWLVERFGRQDGTNKPSSADFVDGLIVVAASLSECKKYVHGHLQERGRLDNGEFQSIHHFEYKALGYPLKHITSGIQLEDFYGV